jgi:hypothetical protein
MGAMLGFTRISFNYFISETTFAYILGAVHLIAEHGWKLLALYRFDPVSGLWRHRDADRAAPSGLSDMLAAAPDRILTAPETVLAGQLDAAREIIAELVNRPPAEPTACQVMDEEFERVRWFPLPAEALTHLQPGQPEARS